MRVILPMHHRSPSAAGTVPTSIRAVAAGLAEPALLGAVIAHPTGGHEAQLHVHGAPEAVSKVTTSTAPALSSQGTRAHSAAAWEPDCPASVRGPLTVGVGVVGGRVGPGVGAAAQAPSVPPRPEGGPTVPFMLAVSGGPRFYRRCRLVLPVAVRTESATRRPREQSALPLTGSSVVRGGYGRRWRTL